MRRENNMSVLGHLVQFLDENGPLGLKPLNDRPVMDDLVTDIDRSAITTQCFFHDTDSAVHTGTESTRTGKQDAKGWRSIHTIGAGRSESRLF